MPAILRGTLDDALEYFNEGADDGGSFFEVSLVDPMPEAIRVWEKYNRWCIGISRGGGGERISETALQQLDRGAVDLFYDIGRTFPLKHGAKDEDKAWNILKGHNLLYHMTDSARMYGRIQVCVHTLHSYDVFMICILISDMFLYDMKLSCCDTHAHCAMFRMTLLHTDFTLAVAPLQNSSGDTGEACHTVHTQVFAKLTNRHPGWPGQMLRGLNNRSMGRTLRALTEGAKLTFTIVHNT